MFRHKQTVRAAVFVAFTSVLGATTGLASEQTGRVTQLIVRASDGLVYFYLDGARTARPACAPTNTYWMIKAEASETGKKQLAMLMVARETGKPLRVVGSNTCTRWVDGEDVDSIMN